MAQGNKIKDFRSIENIEALGNLNILYLQEFNGEDQNPVCEDYNYAKEIFKLLPKLENLDGHTKDLPRLEAPNMNKYEEEVPDFISNDSWYANDIQRPFNVTSEQRKEIEEIDTSEDTFRELLDN
mmetsp:Transcript_17721/g.19903  ORF Transcript_17721/g.19903 Transcript_17721/m.19903 type:complete len:125 (+) Transcript_17721:193-567(+)|eukprot:CAMPEP_0205825002 /NCGR_PEP_ID=MMETSP0206-20130828/23511_1 /ASSEMBLY_ACC=CAM_ASM_000279 /TAXON_ID=36767 /ORGANISM="Euplotes focardii, Strain TN1" /LENGTH=124 /DNA_ID=CAMNT_0053123641 /DNA_START=177 /DNA_END=551 /DNA_ORIENTATION=+